MTHPFGFWWDFVLKMIKVQETQHRGRINGGFIYFTLQWGVMQKARRGRAAGAFQTRQGRGAPAAPHSDNAASLTSLPSIKHNAEGWGALLHCLPLPHTNWWYNFYEKKQNKTEMIMSCFLLLSPRMLCSFHRGQDWGQTDRQTTWHSISAAT